MTENKWLRLASLSLMLILAFACKKDEEEDTKLYMEGALVANIPTYLIAGQDLDIKAEGISKPVDSLTYKWFTKGFSVDSLFGSEIIIKAPVKPGDYTISLYITHPRYSTKTQSFNTTVVNPNADSSFGGVVRSDKLFEDNRDGAKYNYATIGTLDWFTFNLNWKGSGKPYLLIEALGELYGRLYTWEEAKTACPEGWRLPDNKDWENLAKELNGGAALAFDGKWAGIGSKVSAKATINSVNMWKYSPNFQYLNQFGWNAIPAGNSTGSYRTFLNRGEYATWWSADQMDNNNGFYRFIYFDSSDFPYNFASKSTFGASVRCVRDASAK